MLSLLASSKLSEAENANASFRFHNLRYLRNTMLSEFDELVRKRKALKEWWALGSTIAEYDRKVHTLRVDVQKPSMVSYCGQQYAGAKNYHDAPSFFVDSIRREMQSEANRIAKQAYENEIARLDAEIEKQRAAVLEQLASA